MPNSFEELCFMLVAIVDSFAKVFTPHGEGAYIFSSTERLFHRITALQSGLARETLRAEIETRLTLPQPDNITSQAAAADLTQTREFDIYELTSLYVCIYSIMR